MTADTASKAAPALIPAIPPTPSSSPPFDCDTVIVMHVAIFSYAIDITIFSYTCYTCYMHCIAHGPQLH